MFKLAFQVYPPAVYCNDAERVTAIKAEVEIKNPGEKSAKKTTHTLPALSGPVGSSRQLVVEAAAGAEVTLSVRCAGDEKSSIDSAPIVTRVVVGKTAKGTLAHSPAEGRKVVLPEPSHVVLEGVDAAEMAKA